MIEHLAAAIGLVLCNTCERQAQEIARRTKDRIAIRSDEYWLAMAADWTIIRLMTRCPKARPWSIVFTNSGTHGKPRARWSHDPLTTEPGRSGTRADAEREIARYEVALTEALAWLENNDSLVDRSLALQHRIAAVLAEK